MQDAAANFTTLPKVEDYKTIFPATQFIFITCVILSATCLATAWHCKLQKNYLVQYQQLLGP